MYEVLFNKAKELDLDLIKADFNRFLGSKENIRLIYNRLDDSGKYYNKVINLQEDIAPFKFVMNTWSGIYKRSFIEKHHIRHNVTPGASFQDNGFWFQTFAWAKRAYFLDKPLYMNRRDNINSSVKSRGKIYAMKYEYDFIREFLDKNAGLKTRLLGVYQHKKFQNYMFTFGRIDISHKKEFIKFFSNEFKKARNELDLSLFDPKELKALNLIIKNPVRYYQKTLNRLSLAEKIFSLRNEGIHKVICLLGIKFKFRKFI